MTSTAVPLTDAPIATASRRDPGFGVYVHWPFCAQKCPYCDFNSHVRHKGIDEGRFAAAFLTELAETRSLTGPQTVSSVFFGGGTPSLMQPETVGAILDRIAQLWEVAPDAEVTLEANPGSVEMGRFRGYRAAGVNRVSLGVQSLRDAELKRLGRIHSAAEAEAAIDVASTVFDRFSFDLIYARPGQTPAAWRQELAQALALAGGHLSLYQLTIEPETPFAALHAAGKLIVPDADAALALYDVTQELTSAAGLPAYEISNHARVGEESRHNLIYWRYGTYAGIGPGAHGRLPGQPGERLASETHRLPEAWLAAVEQNGHGRSTLTPLTPPEQTDEMLLMGLRLTEGIDLDGLAAMAGLAPAATILDRLESLALIERLEGDSRIRASGAGRLVLNALVAEISRALEPAQPQR